MDRRRISKLRRAAAALVEASPKRAAEQRSASQARNTAARRNPKRPGLSRAEALEICAACSHARPGGCTLIDAWQVERIEATRGCSGCGSEFAAQANPNRWYELVIAGRFRHPSGDCPLN